MSMQNGVWNKQTDTYIFLNLYEHTNQRDSNRVNKYNTWL